MTYAKREMWRQYEPLLVVLLGAGLRIGECLVLTWDDIDFEENIISINKTLVYIKGSKKEKSKFVCQPPKTKSGIRTIPLLSEVARALKRQKVAQSRLRLFMGPAWKPLCGFENLVFTKAKGTPFQAGDIRRFLNRIVEEINREETALAGKERREPVLMEHVPPHALRHSYAVAAIKSGDDIKTVQGNLDHATAAFTLDVYGHVTDQMQQASAARMDAFIKAVSSL